MEGIEPTLSRYESDELTVIRHRQGPEIKDKNKR